MSRPQGDQIRFRSPDPRRFDARAVVPEGSLTPRVYLVGEAPGRREAETGRPFVGHAGTALRDLMREAGMNESHRPIHRSATFGLRNRKPTNKELRDYGPIVLADIASVRPKLIIALGKSAAFLFGVTMSISSARKRVFYFRNTPVRITYHPGFVLRFDGRGSQLWRTAVRDLRAYWKLEGSSFRAPRYMTRYVDRSGRVARRRTQVFQTSKRPKSPTLLTVDIIILPGTLTSPDHLPLGDHRLMPFEHWGLSSSQL